MIEDFSHLSLSNGANKEVDLLNSDQREWKVKAEVEAKEKIWTLLSLDLDLSLTSVVSTAFQSLPQQVERRSG